MIACGQLLPAGQNELVPEVAVSDVDEEQLWAAVAEPSRRRVLDVLVAYGQATPTAIARELPVTRQAVSKHLDVLLQVGMVTQRREGREVRYAVDPQRLAVAAQAMAAAADRWSARLRTIRRPADPDGRRDSS
ncbi:MAG: helix-turn-helix transcriptional regulator [Actinobacteria bacterium]|nr:helix-turn-helix transcriptional regulator [Actinomycetota bacterium]